MIDTTLWNFKQRLKEKSNRSYKMMCLLQDFIEGVIFKTHYVYCGTEPYLRLYPGFVKVVRKPSFLATRLIVKQILHCDCNDNLIEIVKVINS